MFRSNIIRIVAATAVMFGTLGTGVGTAAEEPTNVRLTQGMTIAGIDRQVAESNGFEVRVAADGQEYVVEKGAPANTDATTSGFSQVGGGCGSSYIDFNGIGGARASLATGFNTYDSAVSYSWQVDISDTGGVSAQDWGGPLNFQTEWDGYRTLFLSYGGAFGVVDSGYSYALLYWGGICSSGGPSTTTEIY